MSTSVVVTVTLKKARHVSCESLGEALTHQGADAGLRLIARPEQSEPAVLRLSFSLEALERNAAIDLSCDIVNRAISALGAPAAENINVAIHT